MPYHDTILATINNHLDEHNITTSEISAAVGAARKDMLALRNGDKKNTSLLLDVYNYLYPDQSDQDSMFIKAHVKDMSLKELKLLYRDKDLLLEDLKYIKKYQYNDIMRDVLARICIKNSRNLLRKGANSESDTLL